MKTKLFKSRSSLFSIPVFLLLLSCSSNESETIDSHSGGSTVLAQRHKDTMPFNTANAYDSAGQLHNELLSSYYENSSLPSSISGIIALTESTGSNNSSFNALKTSSYDAADANRISYLLGHPATNIQNVLQASELGATAKSSLNGFITTVLDYVADEERPEVLYDFIIDYEDSVLDHPQMSAKEKEIILITTSIARHSAHFRKKRPKKNTDPDWDWLTLNIIGAVEGAGEGKAQAISTALACGIVENR